MRASLARHHLLPSPTWPEGKSQPHCCGSGATCRPNQNCDNVKCENFLCTINNLKMNNQYTIKIVMRIWMDTFINADFQRITLTSSAQIDTRNPLLIINSNTLTMPVEISRPMKEEVPTGVIVGSVIGGLLVLLALIAALWKELKCFTLSFLFLGIYLDCA
ncbi:integrin alpha-2-like [Rhincodon typus]|uniref:integrin alpha-2-like n=1 Tax=Rhincodon typus TaxID=259920 RepID=UPI00202F8A52|nr:integrin alpha-2-like [Rhincodon typus]